MPMPEMLPPPSATTTLSEPLSYRLKRKVPIFTVVMVSSGSLGGVGVGVIGGFVGVGVVVGVW